MVESSARHPKAHAIFATRQQGAQWKLQTGRAYCVVFFAQGAASIDGFAAEIINRSARPPAEPPNLYAAWGQDMKGWWLLKGARQLRSGLSLAELPGSSIANSLDAPETFDGQCSFAYWRFADDPRLVLC